MNNHYDDLIAILAIALLFFGINLCVKQIKSCWRVLMKISNLQDKQKLVSIALKVNELRLRLASSMMSVIGKFRFCYYKFELEKRQELLTIVLETKEKLKNGWTLPLKNELDLSLECHTGIESNSKRLSQKEYVRREAITGLRHLSEDKVSNMIFEIYDNLTVNPKNEK